ncbi:MAG: SoxR reducing system RseC family protein [Elusimicrobiota bacterium]
MYSMEEIATVVEIADNKLKLLFNHQQICEKCGICHKSANGTMYLELENTIGVRIGDKILVTIKPSNLKISLLLYGFPSVMFITGIFGGYFLYRSEISGFTAGILFLAVSFIIIKVVVKKYKPKIEKII